MNNTTITSAQYVLDPMPNGVSSIRATINGVEWFVPLDPSNTYYQEIMRQVEAGELTIEPAD